MDSEAAVGSLGTTMSHTVKELFPTVQGEGANIGRVAVFIRFAGCNLWSGREEDRARAVCQFCDTDFVGGMPFASAEALADAASDAWQGAPDHKMAVLTGGEPLLQADAALIEALKASAVRLDLRQSSSQSEGRCVAHTMLNESIGGTTMEHLAGMAVQRFAFLPATRVVIRRPTLGYVVEARETSWPRLTPMQCL